MRKKIVASNWKMNNTLEAGYKLASEVSNMVKDEVTSDVEVVLCTPFIHLTGVSKLISGKVKLGAQNCYTKKSGAFTGEVSAEMLQSAGVSYVLVGHSERREYFGESNAMLADKVNIILENGMRPIFCCGESLAQREAGIHFDLVCSQLTESLFHLTAEQFANVVVAYEPIWAIGTGVTASTEQAQEMHAILRKHIAAKYGAAVADNTTIQYGGSCSPANAPELFACPDIDGGLIGGASLEARKFLDVVKAMK